MKRIFFAVFALLSAPLLFAGGAAEFARNSNIYSLRIFNLAVSQKLVKDTENLALAPALIQSQCGALFCGGADFNAAAFCLPQTPQACLADFEKFGSNVNLRGGGNSLASVIFTKRFLPLKPEFAKTAKAFSLGLDSFNPELAEVAAVKIGQWLDWVSGGAQKDFSSSHIPAEANLMLISCAAFDFSRVPADSETNIKFAFKSGQVVEKSAARFSRGAAFCEFADFDAAIFTPPDSAFSAVFLKPKTMQRAKTFLANLDAETFENSFKVLKLLAGESGGGSQIIVPKFSLSGGIVNLNSAVSQSGAAEIFKDKLYPNFSAEKLKVGNVLQACSLSFMCAAGTASQVATKTFVLDKPFAVAVVDNNSARIIMLSAIENPKKR